MIGADLGRLLGLAAEFVVERTGRNQGSWEIYPPGWGVLHERNRVKRASPHRPPLRIASRRGGGWSVDFGPCEKGCGKVVDGQAWRGAFVDLLSLSYVADADRSASFSEHRENVDLPPCDLPIAVEPGAGGASQMADAVQTVHELAITLDERAAEWFTTPRDRAEGRGRVDLARTASPGKLAADLLGRAGVRAPMEALDLSPDEQDRWCESFHGGRTDAHPGLLGLSFSAVSLDVSSCFPLVAHLVDWWGLAHRRVGRARRSD